MAVVDATYWTGDRKRRYTVEQEAREQEFQIAKSNYVNRTWGFGEKSDAEIYREVDEARAQRRRDAKIDALCEKLGAETRRFLVPPTSQH